MTELKTLKDLTYLKKGRKRDDTDKTGFYDIIQIGEYDNVCYSGQLKQEAQKWIDELEKEQKIAKEFIKENQGKEAQINESLFWKESVVDSYNHLIIKWIKDFFNLEEK